MSDPTKAMTDAGLAGLCDYLLHSVVAATKEHRAAVVSATDLLKQQAERIAELEAATRWRPMSECPDEDVQIIVIWKDRHRQPKIEWAYMALGDPFALGWLPTPPFEEPKS